MTLTPLRRLLVPMILLVAALVFRSRWAEVDAAYQHLVRWLPLATLGVAAGLGAFFNRARLLAAALTLLFGYLVLVQASGTVLSGQHAPTVYSFMSLALPLVLLALLFTAERGVRSGHGALVIALAPVLWLAASWFAAHASADLQGWLAERLALYPYPGFVLSSRAAGVLVIAIIAGMVLLTLHGGEDTAALTGSLIFVFAMLALFDRRWMPAVMFGAAGLNLCVSLLRSSHEMAFRDELTGLLGRRALNDRLKGLGRSYVIAMLDVDHFKKFNDTWGHDVGDDVLKMVAAQIDEVRGGGTAYRYGGEEFCIVFPGRTVAQCVPHLENVRRAVARYQLVLRDSKQREVPQGVARSRRGRRRKMRGVETVSVTISIGMAERNDRYQTPEQVIEAADAALYRAKEKGRNCLVH
ncbi:MAG: GGDEF domain-containing protein [Gammaproteobacteria bacterium]|nr:GGDEF domain-containing protein [Gammaproteobacteria bacterium]